MLRQGKYNVLVISDTQAPFEHKDTVPFLAWLKNKYKPDYVVHVGDEVDFHTLSKYIKNPDGFSAGDEMKASRAFMKKLYKLFPECYVCTSNHVDRPYDRAFEAGIPRSFLKDIHEVLEAPKGWKWDERWEIDEIIYEHGHHLPSGLVNVVKNIPRSTVYGHFHSGAGILYGANRESLKFAFNVGCLIDNNAYAFTYGKKMINKPIIGCGIVEKGVPKFIPMLLNKQGRWVKKQV